MPDAEAPPLTLGVHDALAPTHSPPRADQTPPAPDPAFLRSRWPDVVDHVKTRNGILASLLTSARPERVEDGDGLVVGFGTDFNRKRAESSANRKLIEDALQHAFGRHYRLRCTVAAADAAASLLNDPVINYAARAFGGQPRHLDADEA